MRKDFNYLHHLGGEMIENENKFLCILEMIDYLIHYVLMTPYGDRDLGQHWLR